MEWEEGVEEFKSMLVDDLWNALGLGNEKQLPYFNDWIDPFMHNYWEHTLYMEANQGRLVPLQPKWHQLIGSLKLVSQGFKGKPLMLMDEVGVGKTLQLIGGIVILAHFRETFKQCGWLPGIFGEPISCVLYATARITVPPANCQWHDNASDPNIPDQPILLIVPPSLEQQFVNELRRYLRPKSFDILLYTSTWTSCSTWWEDVYEKSNHRPGQRIVVARTTLSAVPRISEAVLDTYLHS
jgi:hypothetical protein